MMKKLQTNTIDNWKNFGSKSIEHAKKLSEIVNNFTTKDRIIALLALLQEAQHY